MRAGISFAWAMAFTRLQLAFDIWERDKEFPTATDSKRFRLVSEQRETEERDSWFWPREKWKKSQKMKVGGGGGEGRNINAVHVLLGSHTRPPKFISAPLKALPACRRLLFPLLHVVPFPRATKEIGDVCTQAAESQTFYQSIMTADHSIKCRCANSGMTGQVDGFQNPGDCLQAFPSFLPHPLSALLLAPFFERSLIQNPRLPLPLSSLRERGKRERRKI